MSSQDQTQSGDAEKNNSTIPSWVAASAIPELMPRNPAVQTAPSALWTKMPTRRSAIRPSRTSMAGRASCPRKTPAPRFRRMRVEHKARRKNPQAARAGGANVGGAQGPVSDPNYKSEAPAATSGGATKSPADEQPASETSESDRDDDSVGPTHTPGTGRGESLS